MLKAVIEIALGYAAGRVLWECLLLGTNWAGRLVGKLIKIFLVRMMPVPVEPKELVKSSRQSDRPPLVVETGANP